MKDINKVIEALKQLKEDIDQKIEMIAHEQVYQAINADPKELRKMKADLNRYLAMIDSGIANNVEVRNAFAGNTSKELNDAIRALVNDEMKNKLDSIGVKFNSETAKRVEQMDKFDLEQIEPQSIQKRILNARKHYDVTKKAIELGELFGDLKSQFPDMSKDELKSYLKSFMDSLENYTDVYDKTNSEELKKSVEKLMVKSAPKTKKKVTKDDIDELLTQLEKIGSNPDVKKVVTDLKLLKDNTRGENVSPSKINKILTSSKLSKDDFDWDACIKKEEQYNALNRLKSIKSYIKKDPGYRYISSITGKSLDEIEGTIDKILAEKPVDYDKVKAQMQFIQSACGKLKKENYVENSVNAFDMKDKLKQMLKNDEKIINNLAGVQSKHITTTTREIFGQKLSARDKDGNLIDLAQKRVTPELLDELYNNLEDNSFNTLHQEYMSDPYTEKPGLLRRTIWKITHPSSWFKGYGELDVLEANYAKSKIRDDIKELQEETSASWTLSKDEFDRIDRGSFDIDKMKQAQREKIMSGTNDAKGAKKSIDEEIAKKQRDDDLSL